MTIFAKCKAQVRRNSDLLKFLSYLLRVSEVKAFILIYSKKVHNNSVMTYLEKFFEILKLWIVPK
jgi:hypothetical protein